jgi:hypothetical protein
MVPGGTLAAGIVPGGVLGIGRLPGGTAATGAPVLGRVVAGSVPGAGNGVAPCSCGAMSGASAAANKAAMRAATSGCRIVAPPLGKVTGVVSRTEELEPVLLCGGVVVGNVPDGVVPDGSVPDGNVPVGNVPDGNVPDGNVPVGSVPEGNVPDGNVPDGSVVPRGGGFGPSGSAGATIGPVGGGGALCGSTRARAWARSCAFCVASAGTVIGGLGAVKGSISTSGVGSKEATGGVCTTTAFTLLPAIWICGGAGGRWVG